MNLSSSAWIYSARFDICFILAPAFAVSLFAVACSDRLSDLDALPGWWWLILIVGVDAGHVYATLFRTYFVKDELRKRNALLTLLPLFSWLTGSMLYSLGELVFWRMLAYLALFHFIRQQYGFMMIYNRHEVELPRYCRPIDRAAIYLATLYPVIYWHCHARSYTWFTENDFIRIDSNFASRLTGGIYLLVLGLYVIKEGLVWKRAKSFNLARNLLLAGTALSWYIGIVAFDDDLIFTATNVIAHGIPYYALVWAYGHRQSCRSENVYVAAWFAKLFEKKTVLIYLGVLFTLAFIEEGLWDGFIWRDERPFFFAFEWLPAVQSVHTRAWLVPLLAVPQTTHYLLDAFIWRLHRKHTAWKSVLTKATQ